MGDLEGKIIVLSPADEGAIEQVAALLIEGFKAYVPNAWNHMAAALEQVCESFGKDRISRIVVDQRGEIVGWIGGRFAAFGPCDYRRDRFDNVHTVRYGPVP